MTTGVKEMGVPNIMSNGVWFTWENQRRNRTLSQALNARLFEFNYESNRLCRYAMASWKTIITMVREKPQIIFTQNPSLILSLLVVACGRIFSIPVVMDSHNAGLFPLEGKYKFLNRFSLFLMRKSTLTIVSNENLKAYVEKNGVNAFTLPDPIPSFQETPHKQKLRGEYNLLFICTFSEDEPYLEVIKAAMRIDEGVCIYVSGNFQKKKVQLIDPLPNNVILTGFLSEPDYVSLLNSVDIVIDLTTRDNCLVCGAYEAVAAGKPLVLSDTSALRQHFRKGALFTDNTAESLVLQITQAIKDLPRLTSDSATLRETLIAEWKVQRHELLETIERSTGDVV